MNKKIFLFLGILILFLNNTLAIDDIMGIQMTSNDTTLGGDATFEIFDASTGGTLVYNETFPNNVSNGQIDVMLGSFSTELHLIYGKNYYMNINVAGTDLNFDGNDRQQFQSSIGNITSSSISPNNITEDLIDFTGITLTDFTDDVGIITSTQINESYAINSTLSQYELYNYNMSIGFVEFQYNMTIGANVYTDAQITNFITSTQINASYLISENLNSLAELNTQISGDLISSAQLNASYTISGYIDETDFSTTDFGDFSCTGGADGCLLDPNVYVNISNTFNVTYDNYASNVSLNWSDLTYDMWNTAWSLDTDTHMGYDNLAMKNDSNIFAEDVSFTNLLDYHNLTSIPTCTGTDKLFYNGADFSCTSDVDTITTLENVVFSNKTNLPSDWDITNYTGGTGITVSGHEITSDVTDTDTHMGYTNIGMLNETGQKFTGTQIFDVLQAEDWTNVSITESQISDFGVYLSSTQLNASYLISENLNSLSELNTQISGDLISSAQLNASYLVDKDDSVDTDNILDGTILSDDIADSAVNKTHITGNFLYYVASNTTGHTYNNDGNETQICIVEIPANTVDTAIEIFVTGNVHSMLNEASVTTNITMYVGTNKVYNETGNSIKMTKTLHTHGEYDGSFTRRTDYPWTLMYYEDSLTWTNTNYIIVTTRLKWVSSNLQSECWQMIINGY